MGRGSDASSSRCAVRRISAICDSLKSSPAPAADNAALAASSASARDGPSAAQSSRSAVAPSPSAARDAARAAFGPKPATRSCAASLATGESVSSEFPPSTDVFATVSPAVPAAPRRFAPPLAPFAAARLLRWSCASSRNCAGSASSSQLRMSQSSARVVRLRLCSLNASARSRSASTAGAVAFIAAATAFAPKPFFSSCAHVLRSTSSGSTSTRMSTSTAGAVAGDETREPFDPPGVWAPGLDLPSPGASAGPRARRIPCTSSWLSAVIATTSWVSPPPRPPPPRPPPLPPRPPPPPLPPPEP